jgi:hypothetical protein
VLTNDDLTGIIPVPRWLLDMEDGSTAEAIAAVLPFGELNLKPPVGQEWRGFTTLAEFDAWLAAGDPQQFWHWHDMGVPGDYNITPGTPVSTVKTLMSASVVPHWFDSTNTVLPPAQYTVTHVQKPDELASVVTVTYPADVAVGSWVIYQGDPRYNGPAPSDYIMGEQIKPGQTQTVFTVPWTSPGGMRGGSVYIGHGYDGRKSVPLITIVAPPSAVTLRRVASTGPDINDKLVLDIDAAQPALQSLSIGPQKIRVVYDQGLTFQQAFGVEPGFHVPGSPSIPFKAMLNNVEVDLNVLCAGDAVPLRGNYGPVWSSQTLADALSIGGSLVLKMDSTKPAMEWTSTPVVARWQDAQTVAQLVHLFQVRDEQYNFSWEDFGVPFNPDYTHFLKDGTTLDQAKAALAASALGHYLDTLIVPPLDLTGVTTSHFKDPDSLATDRKVVFQVDFPADKFVGQWIIMQARADYTVGGAANSLQSAQIAAGQTSATFKFEYNQNGMFQVYGYIGQTPFLRPASLTLPVAFSVKGIKPDPVLSTAGLTTFTVEGTGFGAATQIDVEGEGWAVTPITVVSHSRLTFQKDVAAHYGPGSLTTYIRNDTTATSGTNGTALKVVTTIVAPPANP